MEDELGGNGFEVGLVVGAFAVSAAVVRPWAGRIGDRYGRRVLLSGGALLVGVATLALHPGGRHPGPRRPCDCSPDSARPRCSSGAATATQDMAPSHRRGEAASYFSVALYSGLALGPALGEHLADTSGYHRVWIVAGGASLVAAAPRAGHAAHARRPTRREPTSLLHPAALGPGLVLMLGLIPFTGFAAFLAVYGPDIGLEDTGPVFFAYAGMVLAIRIFGAKLPDRLGLAAGVDHRAGLGGLRRPRRRGVGIGGGGVDRRGARSGSACRCSTRRCSPPPSTGVPDHERSQAVGTFSLFFDLSQGVGAPLLGLVVALSSERGAFAVAALVAGAGFWAQHRLRQQISAGDLEPALPVDGV